MESILSLFATDKLVIKGQSCKFRLFLGFEFDPTFDELNALTAALGFLARSCNGHVLFLEIDPSDVEAF